MPGKSTTLLIKILADATQASKQMGMFSKTSGKFSKGLNVASVAAAGTLTALGAMGAAAAEDAKGQALLANAMRKSAGASDDQIKSVEDWVSKTTLATGVADDQLRPALSTLARATGDVTKSQQAMTTVLDVSAATGKDTQSVAEAVAKAYAGNTTSLGKMVPGMNKAILKSGDMTAIMAELGRVTGGSAAVAADTAAGKWGRAQVAFAETKESIGAALLPMIEKVTSKLATFGTWAANNAGLMQKFAVGIGILAGAILVLNTAFKLITVATRIFTVVTWAMNSAWLANPIVWIIVIIVALVAVIVIAYKKSDIFRAIVQGAFKAIGVAAVAVKNALVIAWRAVLVALGAAARFIKAYVVTPIVAYFTLIWTAAKTMARLAADAWSGMKSAFMAVYRWIKTNVIDPMVAAFNSVKDVIEKVIGWIKKIKIPAAVSKLINKVGGNLFVFPPPPAPPPAPGVNSARGRGGRAATEPAAGGQRDALASLNIAPEVIVQVSDRKMAQLIDVSIRANATSAARTLSRRRVVTV